jgi:NitT/TauT family transport system substrate-binding protein
MRSADVMVTMLLGRCLYSASCGARGFPTSQRPEARGGGAKRLLAVLLGIAIAAGACTTPSPPGAAPSSAAPPTAASAAPRSAAVQPSAALLSPPITVRISTLGLSGEAGTFLAVDRGYFKAEGIEVEFVPGLQGTAVLGALLSGDLELGSIALDVSAINAVSRNVDERIVAPLSYIPAGDKNAALLIRQDHIDSGRYREPRDLKGLTIATGSVPKSSAQNFVEQALAKGGLKAEDADLVTMGFPDMLPALANKAIDAAWEVEPLATAAENQGFAREVMWSGDLFPDYDPFLLVVSPQFAQSRPEALNRVITAHLRGQRDYHAAFVKNEGGPEAKTAVIQSLTAYTPIKDARIWQELTDKGRMHSVDPNGELHLQGFQALQDYFVRVGTLQEKIDILKVIDRGPMDYALGRLGRLP